MSESGRSFQVSILWFMKGNDSQQMTVTLKGKKRLKDFHMCPPKLQQTVLLPSLSFNLYSGLGGVLCVCGGGICPIQGAGDLIFHPIGILLALCFVSVNIQISRTP